MKMSLGVVVLCVLTLVELSDEAVYKKLSSVDDLKSVYSEKYLPMHNLILLHWFANTVNINNNNVVHLTYDPSRDFGSHYYGNCDEMLAPVPQGYQYYTVGNLNPPNGNFPPYVLYPQVIEYAWMGRNRDRIIVQAQTGGSHRVSQMYLTKHFTKPSQCSRYDPNYTFELSTDLLQQLRLFSFTNNSQTLQQLRDHFEENIDDTQLNDLINIWGSAQARLGLLFLIVTPQRANMIGLCKQKSFLVTDSAVDITDDWQNCELQQMQLDVKTGDNGKAKIVWRNVPQNQINDGAAMVLFNNQIDQKNNITYKVIQSSEGSFDTLVPLNEGLQVRLHKVQGYLMKEEVCRSQEFESADAVPICGNQAKLQLNTKNGKFCFMLYIEKRFQQWISGFCYSWVGLYKSPKDSPRDYLSGQWQWTTKFKQSPDTDDFETYFYCTGTAVTSGYQARFMISDYNEIARTPPWP